MLHVVCSTQRDETRGKEIGVTSDRYRNYTTQQTPTNIGKGGKRKNRELRVLKRRNLSTEAYNIDSISVIYTMSLTTNSSYSRLQCASKAPVVEWCVTISNQFSLFFSWMERIDKTLALHNLKKKNWVYTINFTKDLNTAFGRMNFADFVSCVQMKRVEGYFHSYGIKEDQLD